MKFEKTVKCCQYVEWKLKKQNIRRGPKERADGKDNKVEQIKRFGYIQNNCYMIRNVSALQLLVQIVTILKKLKQSTFICVKIIQLIT